MTLKNWVVALGVMVAVAGVGVLISSALAGPPRQQDLEFETSAPAGQGGFGVQQQASGWQTAQTGQVTPARGGQVARRQAPPRQARGAVVQRPTSSTTSTTEQRVSAQGGQYPGVQVQGSQLQGIQVQGVQYQSPPYQGVPNQSVQQR